MKGASLVAISLNREAMDQTIKIRSPESFRRVERMSRYGMPM